ncbi:MAG: hypothetical protein A2X56_00515 [Nitrospirae bacterium GWC2_57_13]|jgi:anti-sigma B factor antagonist|nr:MAG: hypothetical protein A2072_03780 [Nitrospirae bacterium GWC1_57_7]OGW28657.1 MAG: hypothetical protein A2X56_00515 [Nitrospirae bacterium GWC2_57_13]OGW40788.1 MAG: hypothetical protein A2X57_05020 [Nitrospirae bacterium GWD2_57_8]HAR46684.1 anti-anti-sigma factor [Nitrospiraceae bacterium]HAS53965.1 anti-anti-sigma factor [Nitrospiraceae bacterium]
MKAEVSLDRTDHGMLMKIRGDVDMSTSPDVRGKIAEAFRQIDAGSKAVLIDLSQVRYMDSSGIATLVEAMQNCMKRSLRLRLVDLSPPVRDIFELARLSSVFEIYASLAEAEAGL